ncbi:multisubunit sodium/proton antiporter MrpE subunit [Tamaricihabitans halophyticus]|uniref:Multisubunit sodium/proton antiporter MrpE subunit n=1 Tax=Tamaricihabitans halophyticus TaxID=1262583 RepID=A0A4R2R7H1_9PSEU|nr:Na+/H+ antiporter subunit E [Tamaricihabitans halophyticus]TCP55345.1 multisubunit sodium/proton antiporter MrpE subunit [Tamaricihabitans halophyticus]
MSETDESQETPRAKRLPLVCWLVVFWLLLWRSLDIGMVLLGIAVALLVVMLFPMPRLSVPVVLRPLSALWLATHLVFELVTSALRLLWYTRKHARDPDVAIVEVPILSDVDHVIAVAANMISLAPGTFVLQIDRERRLFYVYTVDVDSPAKLAKARRHAISLQTKVVRAFAPRDELRALASMRDRQEEAR